MTKKNKYAELPTYIDHGIDINNSTLRIDTGVDASLVARVNVAFHYFNMSKNDVTIFLNCPGGDETAGMAIYDIITASPCHVTIIVAGEAISMGAVILQAADVRTAYPHSVIMHHTGEANEWPGHKENVRRYYKWADEYDINLDNIMLGRVNEKRAKDGKEPKPLSWWKKEDTWDKWLTPAEAIETGLLDTIHKG